MIQWSISVSIMEITIPENVQETNSGTWQYGLVSMVVFCWRLDLIVLEIFSNLSDSMILLCGSSFGSQRPFESLAQHLTWSTLHLGFGHQWCFVAFGSWEDVGGALRRILGKARWKEMRLQSGGQSLQSLHQFWKWGKATQCHLDQIFLLKPFRHLNVGN